MNDQTAKQALENAAKLEWEAPCVLSLQGDMTESKPVHYFTEFFTYEAPS